MISLYSTWWVKPEQQHQLLPVLKQLAKDVKKHEPGTLMYLVHSPNYHFPKVEKDKKPIISEPMVRPGTIIFVEKYESWDAFKTHLYGKYFTTFVKENKSKLVLDAHGDPFVQVVFMDEETGFIRKSARKKKHR